MKPINYTIFMVSILFSCLFIGCTKEEPDPIEPCELGSFGAIDFVNEASIAYSVTLTGTWKDGTSWSNSFSALAVQTHTIEQAPAGSIQVTATNGIKTFTDTRNVQQCGTIEIKILP